METDLMVNVWGNHVRALREEEGPKPTALGTLQRVSDAGTCLRQRALAALGVPECEEIEESTLLAFLLGQAIHDGLQAALARSYPSARIEEKMDLRPYDVDLSGHADGIIDAEDAEDATVVLEFKSAGGYAAKKAWQYGPKVEWIAQAAMYAMSIDADAIHIVCVAKEKAWATKVTPAIEPGHMREWTLMMDEPVNEYEPDGPTPREIAEVELGRFREVEADLALGMLPLPLIPDEANQLVLEQFPGPYGEQSKTSSWQCRYCRHNSTCVDELGPKAQAVPVHLIPKEEDDEQ